MEVAVPTELPAAPPSKRSPLSILLAFLAGTGSGYAVKPQQVHVDAPPPVVAHGWSCVQSGVVDPVTGIAPEWCTEAVGDAPDAGTPFPGVDGGR